MSKNYVITLILVIAALAAGWWLKGYYTLPTDGSAPTTAPPELAVVKKIIDGITIELDSGHRVRYLGVRTPNVDTEVQCFGKESVQANESILDKKVRLEEDPVLTRARDGAWVRYVYLIQGELDKPESPAPEKTEAPVTNDHPPAGGPNPNLPAELEGDQSSPNDSSPKPTTSSSPEPSLPPEPEDEKDIFINERILEGGFGFPVVSQEMRYGERMLSAARFASATGKGLWKQCKPAEKDGELQTEKMEECVIKGVVTRDLQKIYRTPDCPGYQQTTVIESQGGRWFCAEDIARDEGWRKGSDCTK